MSSPGTMKDRTATPAFTAAVSGARIGVVVTERRVMGAALPVMASVARLHTDEYDEDDPRAELA